MIENDDISVNLPNILDTIYVNETEDVIEELQADYWTDMIKENGLW